MESIDERAIRSKVAACAQNVVSDTDLLIYALSQLQSSLFDLAKLLDETGYKDNTCTDSAQLIATAESYQRIIERANALSKSYKATGIYV